MGGEYVFYFGDWCGQRLSDVPSSYVDSILEELEELYTDTEKLRAAIISFIAGENPRPEEYVFYFGEHHWKKLCDVASLLPECFGEQSDALPAELQ